MSWLPFIKFLQIITEELYSILLKLFPAICKEALNTLISCIQQQLCHTYIYIQPIKINSNWNKNLSKL